MQYASFNAHDSPVTCLHSAKEMYPHTYNPPYSLIGYSHMYIDVISLGAIECSKNAIRSI